VTAPAPARATARWGPFAALLVLWSLTRLILLMLALNPAWYSHLVMGDVFLYAAKAERMFHGEMPYRDVAIEYPPGSVPFTLLPALLAGTGEHYKLAFGLTMLAVDAFGLGVATRLGRLLEPDEGGWGAGWRVPLAYLAGTFLAGPLLFTRFDIVPGVCVLLACVLAIERRPGLAAAALGYGAAAKLFPVVLAPVLVLALVPSLGWVRSFARTVPGFLAGFAVTVLPALALSASGVVTSVLLYHSRRGVQIESLWANGIDLLHLYAGLPVRELYRFGAFDISSTLSEPAKALSGVATALAIAGTTWLAWRRAATRPGGRLEAGDWVLVTALGVMAFMLPTRVLSPQYLIWLGILAGCVAIPRASGAWVLWALAGPLTQLIFPFRYDGLRLFLPEEIWLLTLRNAALTGIAVVLVRALLPARRPGPGAGPGTPHRTASRSLARGG
jgi:hypothetical protein